jgi:hypothetical protein
MAKRRYAFDERKYEKWLAEGRGKGLLSDYKPWLTIHDVPSTGLSVRFFGRKTERLHHLLSSGEASACLEFDWDDNVADIREQYPLDRDETRAIAAEMGVRHPRDRDTHTDIVMTTDFLLDVASQAGTWRIAWAVKPEEELDDPRVVDKLEIERRYWKKRNVRWYLSTEKEHRELRTQNLFWLAELRSLENVLAPHPDYWTDRCRTFLAVASGHRTLSEVRTDLEDHHGFAQADMVTVIRYLAANKVIGFNPDIKFDIGGPVSQLHIVNRPVAQGPLAA